MTQGIIQRRPTVLFCDLVDSSHLTELLDGEQFWDVVVNYQDACNQVVSRYDGYIYKSLGDGLIVLYGLPLAHEDDARRAVYTGLGIVEAVRGLNPMLMAKHGVELSVRVGVHTGEVVVGQMRGITEIAGSTPAQASRIQTLADPDSTFISRETADLVAGYFDLQSRGEFKLRGMKTPVELLEVLGATEAADRIEAQGGALTPLVGRQAEVRQLEQLRDAAKDGDGRVVLIRGEAGIGKSRLARYLRDLSARTGGNPLQGSCSPYYTSTAFHLLAHMLNRRLGLPSEADDRQRLDSLESAMEEAGMEPAAAIPYLAPILSIDLDPEGPYAPPRLDAVKLRQTTIEMFRSWWGRLAAAEPRVVLIEDLHWAEPSTLEVIERIVDEPPPGLLLVLTARPEFIAWEQAPTVTRIELGPLAKSDRHLMIRSIGTADLPEAVVSEIAERSDGVPLFVEELLQAQVPAGGGEALVPATLRDLFMARLEAAGQDIALAQSAAVIGSRIDVDLLSDVVRIDQGELRRALDTLTADGILETQGLGPDRRYAFRHSLLRDAAYESQLPEAARVKHSEVADALIQRLGRSDPPDQGVIALHLDQAGRGPEAVGFYMEAAQASQSAGAYAEALSKLDRALALIITWPAGEPRALSELMVRMLKAASLVATTGYGSEAAGAEFESALELTESLGERPESVGVQLAIMAYATVRGLRTKAGEIIGLLNDRLAAATPDEMALYGAEVTVSDALHRYGLGDYQGARVLFERAIEMFLARPPGFFSPLWTLPNSGLVAAYAQMVPVLWVQGERTAASDATTQALEVSGTLGFPSGPFSEAYSRAYLGYMYQLEGDWARAVAEFRAVTAIGSKHGFAMWEGLGSIHALIAAAHLEPTKELVAAIDGARRLIHQLGVSAFQPYFVTAQADLTAELGDLSGALDLFDEALALSEELEERHYLAETLRKRAGIKARAGAGAEAVAEDLLKAFEIARDQGAFLFQIRAAIDMHLHLAPEDRPAVAGDALAAELAAVSIEYPEAKQAAALVAASYLLMDAFREKVAILGGGVAGLTAAWRLSEPGWQNRFDSITVYERGWRLGGKAASSRGANGRIEEHGLHVWLGYYENAFRLVRQVYEELDRESRRPDAPFKTWTDAFRPANEIGLEEFRDSRWHHWVAAFSLNDQVPGEPDAESGPMSVIEFVKRSVRLLADFYGSLEDRASAPGRITISSSPIPPDRDGNIFGTAMGKKLMATVLAAAMEAVSVIRAEQQLAARSLPVLEPLGEALNRLHQRLRQMVLPDDATRHLWSLADLMVTTVRGILADGLLTHPDGFAAINDQEYRHWIARHGASAETLDSPLVRGVYDLVFGFQDGDPDRPRFAAGLGLFLSGKLFFEYRGSIFWKPQGGMGDVFCAPLYEALIERGVRFEFFSRVEAVRSGSDGRSIATVEINRQVRLPAGPASYQPLVEVGGLPCFPSRPNLPDDLAPRIDYESIWAGSEGGDHVVLQHGRDFDRLVLAIPVGMIPQICGEIIEANPRWRSMVDRIGTVATQVFQLWLTASPTELGWDRPGVTMTGFFKPFETWSLMEQLLAVEQWPADDRPETLAYFCSTLPTPGFSSYDDPEDPKREHEQVRDNALDFLRERVRHFWPGAVDEDSGTFRWELLAGGGDRSGEDRFDSQFWRANVDPSERYVLSLPGSDKYRLRSDQSGYDNLVLAGDWIDCGLNAGCLEAAVMSGLQAANLLTGKPITDRIAGYYMGWGK